MKVSISGSRNGVDWPQSGETLVVSDDEGAQLCANGLADPVAVKRPVERAVAPAPDVEVRVVSEDANKTDAVGAPVRRRA